MTGLLKDVMEDRASQVGVDGIDVDAVLAAGKGRVRRRRAVSAVAVTVCAAVAVAGVSGVLLRDGDRTDGITPPAAWTGSVDAPVQMAYSTGSVLTLDDATYDAGARIESFVRTASATVYTTPDGGVHLVKDDGGERRRLGSTSRDGYHLVADPDGELVAWVEWPEGGTPEFVVHDVAADREVWRDSTGTEPGMKAMRDDGDSVAYVYALDEGTIFLRDKRGAVAVDLATGKAEVLREDAGSNTVGDADGGTIAWYSPISDDGLVVGTAFGEGAATRRSSTPLLSPGGSYLSTEDGDELKVQDTVGADDRTPRLPSYPFAAAYGWADDDTVQVFAITSDLEATDRWELDFLTCSIQAGTCGKVGAAVVEEGAFSLPIGMRLADG